MQKFKKALHSLSDREIATETSLKKTNVSMSSNVDSNHASITHISHLTGLMLRTPWEI